MPHAYRAVPVLRASFGSLRAGTRPVFCCDVFLKCRIAVGVSSQRRALTTSAATADDVLARARSGAVELGFDPTEVYEPWFCVDLCQQALITLNGALGDPSLAVVLLALAGRFISLSWNVRALQRGSDRLVLAPVYFSIVKAIKDAQSRRGGADGGGASGAAKAEADLIHLNARLKDFSEVTKFNPLQGMGYQFLCLAPQWLLAYAALRGMSAHPDAFRGFVVDPTLWLDSVVLSDPFGVLPCLSGLAVLVNAEVNATPPADRHLKGEQESIDDRRYAQCVLRGALLTFVPLTAFLPAGMLVFMATSATYTAVATWAYRRYWWTPAKIKPDWLVPRP